MATNKVRFFQECAFLGWFHMIYIKYSMPIENMHMYICMTNIFKSTFQNKSTSSNKRVRKFAPIFSDINDTLKYSKISIYICWKISWKPIVFSLSRSKKPATWQRFSKKCASKRQQHLSFRNRMERIRFKDVIFMLCCYPIIDGILNCFLSPKRLKNIGSLFLHNAAS